MTLKEKKITELELVKRCFAEAPDAWNEFSKIPLEFLERVIPGMNNGRLRYLVAGDDLIEDCLVLLACYRRPQLGKY